MAIMRKQGGYSLIEVIISLALAGVLGAGVTVFASQTVRVISWSSADMHAIQQVENAGYWVSHDAQMAQAVTPGPGSGFPLQLNWTDSDNNTLQVTFTVTGGKIERSLSKNGGMPLQTFVAKSIDTDPTLTNCSYANGLLTLNVTATVDTISQTRTFHIAKRPG